MCQSTTTVLPAQLCLLGHSLAGYAAYHDDQQAH
jgi:hypothetical protein